MILAIVGVAVLVIAAFLSVFVYLLGFQLGSRQWKARVEEVRAESSRASRAMHDLTRKAFVTMTEHAERLQNGE